MWDLQNPHTVAYYAAMYEAEQAARDFVDAHHIFLTTPTWGSDQDYAMWHAGAYLDTAEQLVEDMPVWER